MSFRFNENDIGTSGNNIVLQLDGTGKIPVLDGSNITNIAASGYNGLSYAYTSTSDTNFTPQIDYFYYITQANKKVSAGGNVVNINLPYSSTIINGSKVAFEYIPTNGTTAGGQYTITTPSNASLAAQGWTSFELFIDGVSYSDGAIFTSNTGANRSRQLYAYVNGTNLKWFDVCGGSRKLSDIINFDLNSTTPYATGQTYTIATKSGASYSANRANINVPSVCSGKGLNVDLANPITLNFDTNMPSAYRRFFITNRFTSGSTNWGTCTLPAVTASENILMHFHHGLSIGADSGAWNEMTIATPTSTFRWNYQSAAFSSFLATASTSQTQDILIFSEGASQYYAGKLETY